ncbi:chemosensory receptor a [Plakobranchus ocellatus]|uniref:Chemosensory receptor a n=1 Tax=Plakobranchus ocellatus TaxID=259542 RepID=A0AAV4AGQ4_9GAST|nr:chemosensory receptor a [Plakobranchus ocellatus]
METKRSNDSFINNESTWLSYPELFGRNIFFSVLPVMVWIVLGIGAMGILGNILIILVYKKLGFSETIHMSYLALAISDLLSVLSTMWSFIFLSPIFEAVLKQLPIATDVHFTSFTGAWPLFAFSRSTALITAWISLERCLCVVFPIKVKRIITPTVTKIVLLTIFIFGCGPVVFVYIGIESEWRLDPLRNQTKLFVFADDSKQTTILQRFARILYGFVYPVSSWVIVTVSTAILIIQLRASNLWRNQHLNRSVNDMRQTGDFHQRRICERSNRVSKVVIVVACVFIICSFPISLNLFLSISIPGFSINGSFRYLFYLNGLFVSFLSEMNSSVNIIVFTVVSSKFRSALLQVLSIK